MTDCVVDLSLVEGYLNTVDERTFASHGANHVPGDGLTSLVELATWLDAHGLPIPRRGLRPVDLAKARTLRTALRDSLVGAGDGALADFELRLESVDGRLRLVADTGVDGLDRIIETVATSVADGSWSRLKLCASADCRWAFHDTSRSGGGRWCSMNACGNRHKTRAYRQRQAG